MQRLCPGQSRMPFEVRELYSAASRMTVALPRNSAIAAALIATALLER
jgi:hypothetical protein